MRRSGGSAHKRPNHRVNTTDCLRITMLSPDPQQALMWLWVALSPSSAFCILHSEFALGWLRGPMYHACTSHVPRMYLACTSQSPPNHLACTWLWAALPCLSDNSVNAETQRFAEGRREGRKKRLFSSAFLRALCVSALILLSLWASQASSGKREKVPPFNKRAVLVIDFEGILLLHVQAQLPEPMGQRVLIDLFQVAVLVVAVNREPRLPDHVAQFHNIFQS